MEFTLIKYLISASVLLLTVMTPVYAEPVRPSTEHSVYFKGSDYELNVYKIYGRRDGNTLFILGGVQGDEPGGFLSADLYAGLQLEQGNLIVIPRANLKSIILFNRGVEGDMNRLFTDNATKTGLTQEVVKIIMSYMQKSDFFLNMHDGWGFHNPLYISEQRNPRRFGQSIIVDADEYKCDDNKSIDLKTMATTVLDNINARISNADHHLAYFNTKTGDPGTPFKDMQKTATWYALRKHCIPAFGIESSKNINSIELKILYHNYAVNEFMKLMGIIPENPPVYVIPPVLEQALITVNGESLTVKNGDTVKVMKNDILSVKHIETNYERGISCDILGFGNMNNLGQEIPIAYSTKIVFRKDSAKFAEISVEVDKRKTTAAAANRDSGYLFRLSVDGEEVHVKPDELLTVKTGSRFTILGLELNGTDSGLPVNLRGWVPQSVTVNSGDDRGFTITANRADMLARWATGADKKTYPVTVDSEGREIVRFNLRID